MLKKFPFIATLTALMVGAMLIVAVPTSAANQQTIRINFQPFDVAVPANYITDHGLAFGDRGNGFSYGWRNQATGDPVDVTGELRERTGPEDARLRTFAHMDRRFASFDGYWEFATTPGCAYIVTAGVGDNDWLDSVHVLRAEGTPFVNFTPNNNARHFISAPTSVTVLDGFLTIDQIGGMNTKIAFIDIVESCPADEGEEDESEGPSGSGEGGSDDGAGADSGGDVAPQAPAAVMVPNAGMVRITVAQAQPALNTPQGQAIRDASGAEIWLPADADGNGFDDYVVTEVRVIDGEVWAGLWMGTGWWVWVPMDSVTPLTPFPQLDQATADS